MSILHIICTYCEKLQTQRRVLKLIKPLCAYKTFDSFKLPMHLRQINAVELLESA